MLSEPTTIFAHTSFTWRPTDAAGVSHDSARRLYHELHKLGVYHYGHHDSRTLFTERKDGYARCQLSDTSIAIEESNTGFAIDGFVDIVQTVMSALGDELPPSTMQRCKLHCLAQANGAGDALGVLAENMAHVFCRVDPFGRCPSFFGVRFRFVPEHELDGDDECSTDGTDRPGGDALSSAREQPATQTRRCGESLSDARVDVRFESWHNDIEQVWMAADARYPRRALSLTGAGRNIRETYEFLTEKCKAFVDQFDVRGRGARG